MKSLLSIVVAMLLLFTTHSQTHSKYSFQSNEDFSYTSKKLEIQKYNKTTDEFDEVMKRDLVNHVTWKNDRITISCTETGKVLHFDVEGKAPDRPTAPNIITYKGHDEDGRESTYLLSKVDGEVYAVWILTYEPGMPTVNRIYRNQKFDKYEEDSDDDNL